MTKYLVMTLGTGRGVEHGLAQSIQTLNPDRIVFLASEESQRTLDRLTSLVPGFADRFQPVHLVQDPDDVEQCAEDAKAAILALVDQGVALTDIEADFTSGTKAMTAGLSIAATALGVERLVYVTGTRDPHTGRVLTGTERVVSVYPMQLLIDEHRRQLKLLFNQYLFDRGLSLIEQVISSCMRPDIQREFAFWRDLFAAYQAWDRFDHLQAHAHLSALPKPYLRALGLDLGANKELLGRIQRKLQLLEAARKRKVNLSAPKLLELKFSPELLADLFANADRRAEEGRYDDAVARLYRATEFVAQLALAPYGLDTSNLRKSELPREVYHLFPEVGRAQRVISIGLDRSYRLIEALNDERARLYLDNKRLRHLLKARNDSINAHGTTPVTRKKFEELRREVVTLAEAFVPELKKRRLREKATFPRIRAIF